MLQTNQTMILIKVIRNLVLVQAKIFESGQNFDYSQCTVENKFIGIFMKKNCVLIQEKVKVNSTNVGLLVLVFILFLRKHRKTEFLVEIWKGENFRSKSFLWQS